MLCPQHTLVLSGSCVIHTALWALLFAPYSKATLPYSKAKPHKSTAHITLRCHRTQSHEPFAIATDYCNLHLALLGCFFSGAFPMPLAKGFALVPLAAWSGSLWSKVLHWARGGSWWALQGSQLCSGGFLAPQMAQQTPSLQHPQSPGFFQAALPSQGDAKNKDAELSNYTGCSVLYCVRWKGKKSWCRFTLKWHEIFWKLFAAWNGLWRGL